MNKKFYKTLTPNLIEPAEEEFYDGFTLGSYDGKNIDEIVEEMYQIWVNDYKSDRYESIDCIWAKNNPEDYSKEEITEEFKKAFIRSLKDHNKDFKDNYTLKEFGIKE